MFSEKKRAILIVIYNIRVSKSLAFQTSREEFRRKDVKLIIYDNSPQSMLDIALNLDCEYHHDPTNRGLYVAYNFAIEFCKKNKIDLLTILDQDTRVTRLFFSVVRENTKIVRDDIACWIPKVELRNGEVISPFYIEKNIFGKSSDGRQTTCAINSGCTINIGAFNNGEKVFSDEFPLDFLDYDFFYRIARMKMGVRYLPVTLEQSLSVENYRSMSDRRFDSFITFEGKFVNKYYSNKLNKYRERLVLRLAKMIVLRVQLSKIRRVLREIRGK